MPVRVRERSVGGGAAGGGGAHGAAGAGARDQLRARRDEPSRLARARRRPLRLVAHLRRILLRRAAQPQRSVRHHPPNFASVSQGPMHALLPSLVACSLLLCCLCSLTHMTCIHVLGLSREYSL